MPAKRESEGRGKCENGHVLDKGYKLVREKDDAVQNFSAYIFSIASFLEDHFLISTCIAAEGFES